MLMLPSTTELTIISIGSVSLTTTLFTLIFIVTMLRLLRIQKMEHQFAYAPIVYIEDATQSQSPISVERLKDIIIQQKIIQQKVNVSTQEAKSINISIGSDQKQLKDVQYKPRPIST